MVKRNIVIKYFSIVIAALFMLSGSIGLVASAPGKVAAQETTDSSQEKVKIPQQPLPIPAPSTDIITAPKGKYTFSLSPLKKEIPGEYTRKEIESFLCIHAPGFITLEDLYKDSQSGQYCVKAKTMIKHQRNLAENQEISKWFEDRVIVTAKGDITDQDIEIIKAFYDQVNRLIGKKKFIFTPGLALANIIIEMGPPGRFPPTDPYAGETSILQDNMRVRLTSGRQDMGLKLETFILRPDTLINESKYITLTPEEKRFREDQRMVKIYLRNLENPQTRYFAFIHEMMHSLGIPAHSPYNDSHLFPLPVWAYGNSRLMGMLHKEPVLSPLGERMVEMLYRPEILPGMTLKEAAGELLHLKTRSDTPKTQVIAYLEEQKKRLETQKENQWKVEVEKYEKNMSKYLEWDQLLTRELRLLEELEEIRTDYQKDTQVLQNIKNAPNMVSKLVRIKQELGIRKSQEQKWLEKLPLLKSKKESQPARRELARIREETLVLQDLLALEQEIGRQEREVMKTIATAEQTRVEEALRRILRQLYTIDKELTELRTQ